MPRKPAILVGADGQQTLGAKSTHFCGLQLYSTLTRLCQSGQLCCCNTVALIATVASKAVSYLCWHTTGTSSRIVPCEDSAEKDTPLRELYGKNALTTKAYKRHFRLEFSAAEGTKARMEDGLVAVEAQFMGNFLAENTLSGVPGLWHPTLHVLYCVSLLKC